MRLVTAKDGGEFWLGALIGDGGFLALQAAYSAREGVAAPYFASMQSLIEGGPSALDAARALSDDPPAEAMRPLAEVSLAAPLPVPTQIRDFLCFETHLKQAFESAVKIRAGQADDPAAAETVIRASGRFNIPDVWYEQPIYYKRNRFAVCGPEDEVQWPAYSQIIDYELEMAAIVGKTGRDIPRERS